MVEYVLVFATLALVATILFGLGDVIAKHGDRVAALTRMDCP